MFSTHGRGRNKKTHFYYGCKSRLVHSSCSLKYFKQPILDGALLNIIEKEILTKEHLLHMVARVNGSLAKRTKSLKDQITTINREIGSIRQKMDRITELLLNHRSNAEILLPKLKELDNEKSALQGKLRRLEEFGFQAVQYSNLDELLVRLKLLLTSEDQAKRKMCISTFISKIELFNDKAVLLYRNPLDPTRNTFIAPFAEYLESMPNKASEQPKDVVHLWVSYASPRGRG